MDAMVDDIAIPFSKGRGNFNFLKKENWLAPFFSLVFGGVDSQ